MKQKKQKIYKHTQLDVNQAKKLEPLFESAFSDALGGFVGPRADLKKERLEFASKQYANRSRIANVMGTTPLNEDSKIFGEAFGSQMTQLFESASLPGNIVSMGGINSPGNPGSSPGGIWNSAYQPGSGDIPSYVFGLQSQIALHCQGLDLIPPISVDTPKILLNYVETVYGGGELDGQDDFPSIIEVASNYFNYSTVKQNKFKRAKTKLTIWNGDTTANGKAIELLFLNSSLEKAAINVSVLSFGESTDGIAITPKDGVTMTSIVEEINGALAAGAGTVMMDGVALPTNLAAGNEITLNYVSATRTNIAEASTNDNSQGGMSRQQHRKGPKHKLNIVTMDKELHIGGIEIDADTDNIQIKDLAAQGVSVIARLYAGVQNQLIQTIDEYILSHLYRLGVQHAMVAKEAQGIDMNLYIASPANANLDLNTLGIEFNGMEKDANNEFIDRSGLFPAVINSIQSSGYENQMTHADRLLKRILLVSEFVGQQNRIDVPDYIVFGGAMAAAIKGHSKYTTNPTLNTLTQKPELHYTGTLFETLAVYKNTKVDFNDPRILLGRRGDDTDPGAKFLAYDLAASRQTIAEGTMAEKIRAWSRFTIADVGFYPELNYFTFVAINEYGWA